MDARIRDSEALRRVSPTMLRAYLEARGWAREQTWRNRILVWASAGNERVGEILMPLREQSATYWMRIAEAVELLAEMEERSQLDVYHDLLATGSDVIRIRPLNGAGGSGWDLGESVDFLTRARDLITAAARAAERPGQPVYRGRSSGEVAEYVRGVRPLPGYEAGSGLTLHSQVPAGYGEQLDLGDPFRAPFPRRATIALNEGLREASRTAETVLAGRKIADAFEQDPTQAANANLYDAVAALARRGPGVGISVAWAEVRPADAPSGEFAFSESAADVFTEGADLLRQNSPFLDAHVTGEIVRLDRESKEEFDGHAVALCELDGRPIALQVQFDIEDQEEVVRAFRNNLEISVNGDIHREGRKYLLKNPRNFIAPGGTM